LYAIGVPAWIPITLWSVAAFQEYARTKLISLGVSDIGVVTPAERPMRASYIFIILVMGLLNFPGLTIVSAVFLAIQCYSFISVVRFSRSQLLP
jgi:CDP-diacylglycerol--glycerol-3-phosphate 3-phosphatidyltransferase